MTEQQLDGAYVGALFEQVDGEAMSQGVRANGFGNATPFERILAGVPNCCVRDVSSWNVARKQPILGLRLSPPVAENFQ